MEAMLSLRNVTVQYDGQPRPALRNLSLDIRSDERVALLGLNGSGKTTLLYVAVGLLPYQGTVSLDGVLLTAKTERSIRDKTGFLFSLPEDQILFPKVVDDVSFSLERRGMERGLARLKALAMLEKLGISHLAESSPHRLSHGQRQRVALAGTLVADPSLLLFDEPSSALDPVGKRALMALLQTTPTAMVLATHDTDFAQAVCTRFVILEQGSVIEDTGDRDKMLGYWKKGVN
ncbi:MAG: ABC transporter ATP-binding protein [Fibrobacterota bacterium]